MEEEKFEQRTIEYFFKKYGVDDQALKEKLLADVTDVIYDYNMLVVQHEKETDEYRKKQTREDLEETQAKIDELFTAALKNHAA